MQVAIMHEDLWREIRDEVKEYSLKNWQRWSTDKPAWFNDEFKALIPDDFMPKQVLEELEKTHGGKGRERRSSFGGMLTYE